MSFMTTICDLDGTISDDRHRHRLIKMDGPDRWDEYHAACGSDRPMNLGCVRGEGTLIIFTARPESCRRETRDWLNRHKIFPSYIHMRPCGCSLDSVALKRAMVRACLGWELTGQTVIAYDDREDILAMYREYGISTVKVGYEEVEVKSAPTR